MRKLLLSLLPLTLAVFIACESSTDADDNGTTGASQSEMTLRSNMDKLWEDHIVWTRNVIFAVMDELPGATEATTRLLQNQDDIGNAIKPYYGDAAGAGLSKLLRSHITTAAEVLTAAKAGNQSGLATAQAAWVANADSIATFLSTANPTHWPLAEMKSMMQEHLTLTTNEALARLNMTYGADIAAYDAVHTQILKMSDMLSDGIVKQFPDKF